MKNPIFEHLYDNWKAVHALPPGSQRDENMRNVKMLCRGNLHWVIRRLIGGVPSDGEEWCKEKIAAGEMCPPLEFTRKRRHEDLKRKNKQHS